MIFKNSICVIKSLFYFPDPTLPWIIARDYMRTKPNKCLRRIPPVSATYRSTISSAGLPPPTTPWQGWSVFRSFSESDTTIHVSKQIILALGNDNWKSIEQNSALRIFYFLSGFVSSVLRPSFSAQNWISSSSNCPLNYFCFVQKHTNINTNIYTEITKHEILIDKSRYYQFDFYWNWRHKIIYCNLPITVHVFVRFIIYQCPGKYTGHYCPIIRHYYCPLHYSFGFAYAAPASNGILW